MELQVSHISKTYASPRGEVVALRDLSLTPPTRWRVAQPDGVG